ncbi:MAG: monovalent cation/H+ antiporter complex subunit F [Dehalococcoidia bacterium]|nr:monovalent cation/H+ antiporter complex subunit F [Dehalococcoidia bacterium]
MATVTALTDVLMMGAQVMLCIAALLTLAHLLRARSLLERVLALEMLSAGTVAGAGLLTLVIGEPALIDPALAVALVSFAGSIAFASFVERRGTDD